jgi:hypothetical protein
LILLLVLLRLLEISSLKKVLKTFLEVQVGDQVCGGELLFRIVLMGLLLIIDFSSCCFLLPNFFLLL